MKPAPIPTDEDSRLQSLRALEILDTPAEGRFDRITRLARRMFEVPIAAVSLVDEGRQWFKSIQGLPVRETPRDISFCGHAIHEDSAMVVENAAEDARFHDNPLVTGDPQIRFYAGQPLLGPDGAKLGTLCLIDRQPRELSDKDRLALQDLATLVETEINVNRMSATQTQLLERLQQAERQALQDSLTEMWNRAGIMRVFETEIAKAGRAKADLSVIIADLDHFKTINDSYGHDVGDEVLRETARRMRAALRATDSGGRVGGEEFVFVLPDCPARAAFAVAERIRICVAGEGIAIRDATQEIQMTLSLGVATGQAHSMTTPDRLLKAADQALYLAKGGGRNRIAVSGESLETPPTL